MQGIGNNSDLRLLHIIQKKLHSEEVQFFLLYLSEEYQLNDDIDWEADDERELYHVAEERWHLDTALLGNRLYHEVWSVADVGECAEEYCTDRDST